MAIEVRVQGAASIHRLAAHMRAEGRKDLTRQMGRALSQAAEPVKRSIRASAEQVMPRAGGYRGTFLESMKFRTQQRGSGDSASLSLVTYADGTGQRRDIRALEGGKLRHPIYGRSRPGRHKGQRHTNPWSVTSIRAGFHRRGTDGAMDEVEKQLDEVVKEYAQRLLGE